MITIFSIPKAFEGHFNIIQRNAIQSWLALEPKCEIILFGNEDGVAETANEFHLRHISKIKRNEFGTPLLNGVFKEAQVIANYEKVAYVNADIILLDDFIKTANKVTFPSFLMIGQRWDVDFDKPVNFNDAEWEQVMRSYVTLHGKLHGPSGVDYFIFPVGTYETIPPFAIGRPVWDNWLLYYTRLRNIPLIDATESVMVVHQNHPYAHPKGAEGLWNSPEAKENLRLAGGHSHVFTAEDVDWILSPKGLERKKIRIQYVSRYFETLAILNPGLGSWPKIVSMLLSPKKWGGKMARRIRAFFKTSYQSQSTKNKGNK